MAWWPSVLARIGRVCPAPKRDADNAEDHVHSSVEDLLRTRAADLVIIEQAKREGHHFCDIFFSHAGEQKWDLVATLKKTLPSYVKSFVDAWHLQHCENSHEHMIGACGTAHVGVVVISKEFVTKEWPMRELHILVGRHRRGEVGLLPLLWFEDFQEFGGIVNSYKACTDHRRLWGEDLAYLRKTCMVVKGVCNAQRAVPEVVQEVVDASMRLLQEALSRTAPAAGPRPVGFDEQLQSLSEVMRGGKAVWLHGPGGAGKTRMAMQLRRDLEAAGLVKHTAVLSLVFTAGSGPSLSEEEAVGVLRGAVQELEGRDCAGASAGRVRSWFAEAATRPKSLLIVDNVHSQEQLGLLLGEPLHLGNVPFVIFTSRLQQPIGGCALAGVWTQVQRRLHRHAVQALAPQSALQLFQDNCKRPQSVSEGLEKQVVATCGGLPLAVRLVAGVLTGQEDTAAWMAAGQAMVEGGDPADEVLAESEFGLQRTMQHSLLGLSSAAISMFLDTACVLVGRAERDALMVWQQWHGSRRATALLQQLKNRNLLSIDGRGLLWMHDVLRWYGRRVVRGEAKLEGQQHHGSRLWVHDGGVEPQAVVAWQREIVTAELDHDVSVWRQDEATALPDLGSVDNSHHFSTARILFAGRHPLNWPLKFLLWLEVRRRECPELGIILSQNRRLCILRIHNLPDLRVLPESVGQLASLQQLDLEGCSGLTVLPESVGQLKSLQQLNLGRCSGLTVLPESVGQLTSLQQLDLSGCIGLTVLPESVGQLASLLQLDLGGCSGLRVLPESVGQLASLQQLNLRCCSGLTELPESLGQLASLQQLDLWHCNGLTVLPETVGQLTCLQQLNLWGCTGLTVLPESLGQLTCLSRRNLWGCTGLIVLPESVGQLASLQELNLEDCSGLIVLPEWVGQLTCLQQLDLGGCSGLTVLPEWVGQLTCLQQLDLGGCSGLTVLPESVGQLTSLQQLNLGRCSGLTVLPESVGQLKSLQKLCLKGCSGVTVLPESVGQLASLRKLDLSGCTGLTVLPEWVGQLASLLWLNLGGCSGLTVLPESVGQLASLRQLDLQYCIGLRVLPKSVGQLASLQQLNLKECSGLTALPESVGRLASLRELNLSGCSGLTVLPESVGQLASLRKLDLSGCTGLTVLPEWVGQLASLLWLNLGGCSGLTVLPESVGQLASLRQLDLQYCIGLSVLPESVGQLASLQQLNLKECSGLTALPESVGRLASLRELNLSGCKV